MNTGQSTNLPWPTGTQDAQPSKGQQIETEILEGAQIAAEVVPGAPGAFIAEGVQLEPEIHHLISALIALFHKQKVAKATPQPAQV